MISPVMMNTLGLVFDISGALLLFWFGLPADVRRNGMSFIALEKEDEAEKNKARLYDKLGRMGLLALVVGFILQAWSNYM